MAKLYLAALLAFGAASSLQAQPAVAINPSADSAVERQRLHDLSYCLARARPNWARQMLAKPYLSEDQARVASYALGGRDTCLHSRDEIEVTFRTSSVVSSLAEYFLRSEMPQVDATRLAAALSTMTPLNVSEDFGFCVAARNPAAARALALSAFNSPAETAAAERLRDAVELCTLESETLTVDLQSLRALTATALYRGVSAVREGRN
ncbi:MAG TPA: hypothetical protein VLK25_02480 [Allosphingosinicella sp.]|nr:hypothetical protein [Allosphingosinicella sp.]